MSYFITCTSCGYIEKKNIISCTQCNGGLEVTYKSKGEINKNKNSIFERYSSFLPVQDESILKKYPNNPTSVIALNKEDTYAKLEYCSFSSSSKDREAFIEIAMAIELGYIGIAVASTGNMGGALASLCARMQFPCHVFIPADTSSNKVNQIEQFGVNIKKIDGTYDDIVPRVTKFAKNNNFFLASLQAYRFEGYKTIAYEIFEAFGKNLPQNIIVPLGDGTTYVAVWKGFMDLKSIGLIDKCPSMIGVQAENCAPIVNAYINKNRIQLVNNPKTIAKAIRIGDPLDGNYALKVVKDTRGNMFCYSEDQIIELQRELLKEGINAEYTSAITYGPILYNNMKNCLLLITGIGFKN
ncbi:MAG TPA: pyridoxal-phosphate dependent enzyme [Candidatus Woesebacteria bacterium]|nr:pyridoxal-phosphate dependent enzyme [Candidatus Woesebacteria bacterium]